MRLCVYVVLLTRLDGPSQFNWSNSRSHRSTTLWMIGSCTTFIGWVVHNLHKCMSIIISFVLSRHYTISASMQAAASSQPNAVHWSVIDICWGIQRAFGIPTSDRMIPITLPIGYLIFHVQHLDFGISDLPLHTGLSQRVKLKTISAGISSGWAIKRVLPNLKKLKENKMRIRFNHPL